MIICRYWHIQEITIKRKYTIVTMKKTISSYTQKPFYCISLPKIGRMFIMAGIMLLLPFQFCVLRRDIPRTMLLLPLQDLNFLNYLNGLYFGIAVQSVQNGNFHESRILQGRHNDNLTRKEFIISILKIALGDFNLFVSLDGYIYHVSQIKNP